MLQYTIFIFFYRFSLYKSIIIVRKTPPEPKLIVMVFGQSISLLSKTRLVINVIHNDPSSQNYKSKSLFKSLISQVLTLYHIHDV